jgi:hypothetical protein
MLGLVASCPRGTKRESLGVCQRLFGSLRFHPKCERLSFRCLFAHREGGPFELFHRLLRLLVHAGYRSGATPRRTLDELVAAEVFHTQDEAIAPAPWAGTRSSNGHNSAGATGLFCVVEIPREPY